MTELPLEIDVPAVAQMLVEKQEFVLLDVREQNEFDFAKIEGSQLVPLSELSERVSELEPHRDKLIVVHCHHGGRSLHATEFLRGQGFSQVQSMAGGIDCWSDQVDASIPKY